MRLFIIIFLLLLLPSETHATALSAEKESAVFAVKIFTKACFMNYGQPEQTKAFLESKFPELEGEKQQKFFYFTKTKGGHAWAINLKQGNFVVVLSDEGNCHLLTQKADKLTIHTELKKLSDQAKANLPFNHIVYLFAPPEEGDKIQSSAIEVKNQDGENQMVIVGSTPLESAKDKPDALISMVVGSY